MSQRSSADYWYDISVQPHFPIYCASDCTNAGMMVLWKHDLANKIVLLL